MGRWTPGWVFLCAHVAAAAHGAENKVVERDPIGAFRREYHVNDKGEKHGRFETFYADGAKRSECTFYRGEVEGIYKMYYPSGKLKTKRNYKKGKIQGLAEHCDEAGRRIYRLYWTRDNILLLPDPKSERAFEVYSRPREAIVSRVRELKPKKLENGVYSGEMYIEKPSSRPPYKAGALDPKYVEDALRQLSVYRYLCGLGHEMSINAEYGECAQHAAVVSAANRTISHSPVCPPDMDADFFARARRGAGRCNLHGGRRTLHGSIDDYMFDSDPTNISAVGHRAWCLAPFMTQTGLGQVDGFCALWTGDRSGKAPPDLDAIRYPAAGYFPREFLRKGCAWSVASKRFSGASKDDLQVDVREMDQYFIVKKTFALNHLSVLKDSPMGPSIIFRPVLDDDLDLDDRRFWVSIRDRATSGVKIREDYVVHLFSVSVRSSQG